MISPRISSPNANDSAVHNIWKNKNEILVRIKQKKNVMEVPTG